MNTQEMARELNDPGAQELLHAAALARLAYTGRDGFPRVIPIGFYWDAEHIIVCTAPISPKVAALAARPQVALTIDTDTVPNRALLIRGTAAIETVDGVPDEYIKASAKGMDRAQLQDFEAQVRSVYKEMSRIAVTPHWARFYDFGTGRVPGFLLKLGNNSLAVGHRALAGPTWPARQGRGGPGLPADGDLHVLRIGASTVVENCATQRFRAAHRVGSTLRFGLPPPEHPNTCCVVSVAPSDAAYGTT
jgi:hypothetical protein